MGHIQITIIIRVITPGRYLLGSTKTRTPHEEGSEGKDKCDFNE
jgi:hypothetical protein